MGRGGLGRVEELSGRPGMCRATLLEVQNGSRDTRGGSVLYWGLTRRCRTGRETLGEVRNGSGDSR